MASGEDKKIRIDFQVNEQSLQKAKQAIRDLHQEVKGLVETLSKASGGRGGFGSIVSGSGKTGVSSGGSGAGTSAGSANQSIKAGGITDPITNVLVANKNLIRSLGTDAKEALRAMKDSLASSAQEQIREIQKLKREIDSLAVSYNKLGAGAEKSSMAEMMSGKVEALANANKNLAKIQGATGGGSALGGIGQIGASLGIPGMGFLGAATPVAAAVAAIGGVNKLANAASSAEVANLSYSLNSPFLQSGINARVGQSIGGMGMNIRRGDYALNMAYNQVVRDKAVKDVLSSTGLQQELIRQQAGDTNTIGGLYNRGMNKASVLASGAFNNIAASMEAVATGSMSNITDTGRFSAGGKNISAGAMDLEIRQREMELKAKNAEQFAQEARNRLMADPESFAIVRDITSGASGNMALARNAGLGVEGAYRLRMRAARSMRSPEELAAARQQMAAAGGRGMIDSGEGLLGAVQGGFSNAYQIYGLGAQYGAGSKALYGAFQGGMGLGGVDVTAGNTIAGMTARGMMGGNFQGSGMGLAEGLLAVGNTGSIGGDMRMARNLQQGMESYRADLAGEKDPYGAFVNAKSAITAAEKFASSPGQVRDASMALRRIPPEALIDIVRAGKVPEEWANLGVNLPMIREYMNQRGEHAESRYLANQNGDNTEAGKAVLRSRAAGGIAGDLRNLTQGVTDVKQRRAIMAAEISKIAGARAQYERGATQAGVESEIYLSLAGEKDLFGSARGKGAGVAGVGSDPISKAIADNDAANVRKELETRKSKKGDIVTAVTGAQANADSLATVNQSLISGAKDFSVALDVLTKAINNGLKNLGVSAGSSKPGRSKP